MKMQIKAIGLMSIACLLFTLALINFKDGNIVGGIILSIHSVFTIYMIYDIIKS